MNKVAFLLGALERGGTETLMLDTFTASESLEFSNLLVHRKEGSLLMEFERTGVPIYYLPIRHFLDIGYLFRFRKLIKKQGIKLIHAHLPFDAFLAYWACLGLGIKIVLSFHGYDFDYSRLGKEMIRFISMRTNTNIYVSQHLRDYYVSQYHLNTHIQKQEVVYNGIAFAKLMHKSDHSIRFELGISEDCMLLGCIGNFLNVRDQFTICKFLAELKLRSIGFHFVFVGACSNISLFEACVQYCAANDLLPYVHFLGSRNDVPSILNELDAFVYASNHDTFGIAVVEAMAVGIPVFVNDWTVMGEITENGKLANLYKTKDIDDMVNQFLPFLTNREIFLQIAKKNIIYVMGKYSIQNYISNLNAIYQKLLPLNG